VVKKPEGPKKLPKFSSLDELARFFEENDLGNYLDDAESNEEGAPDRDPCRLPRGLSEADWEAAWVAESERRLQEVREGKMKEIPAAEVFARARALRR
jgi:hypothetical protein